MEHNRDIMIENELFPEILGYRIEKKLGRGGMAEVYLGIQETLGRRVAVKILNPLMVKNRQLLQRFINEAKTASRLAHPNIVTVHDVGQVNDYCYIVMEYLQESLVDRIRFSPELRIHKKEALQIVRQIAKALAYAHSEGFIHRDIKPDNILFRKDNTAVLGDFGIARAMDSESQLTTAGMIIGTPHYMSPEQCRGQKIDGQSDIYSLGVVFYEMLTGRIPYKADSAAGVLVKHIQEPVPKLPEELCRYQSMLDHMMAKDKAHRIHSAEELLRLLDTFLPDSPLDSIEASRPEQYVFSGPSTTQTEENLSSDFQPTILSPASDIPKLKNVVLFLLILGFLVGGGYFVYLQWHNSKNGEPKDATDSQSVTTDIDVNERQPVLPDGTGKLPVQTIPTDRNMARNDNQGKVSGDTSGNGKTPSGATENTLDKNYATLLAMAREYFKEEDIEKASEKLNQAAALKNTPETRALQQQIIEFIEAKQDKKYQDYLAQATVDLKKGDRGSARKNVALAEKIKSTTALKKIKQRIEQAERVARENARKAKLDDDAYNVVRCSNSIASLEKYLKTFPNGRYAAEAQVKLDQLKGATTLEIKINDDVAFETATKSGTVAAYQKYLRDNPIGQHVKEATTCLKDLKLKLVKEIKEKLEVKRIRFFESEATAPSLEQRAYNSRFAKSAVRYIHVEIEYENKLYRVADSNSSLSIDFSGPFQQQLKGTINTSQSAATGTYGRGMGWGTAGKWPVGKFTVTVSVNGQKAGQATFEIY